MSETGNPQSRGEIILQRLLDSLREQEDDEPLTEDEEIALWREMVDFDALHDDTE